MIDVVYSAVLLYLYILHLFHRCRQANVHDAYIKYTMNPFTTIRGKIEKPCQGFEQQMNGVCDFYDQSMQQGLQNSTPRKQVEV